MACVTIQTMRLPVSIALLVTAASAQPKLDSAKATEAAQASGLKRSIYMPEVFPCPAVTPAKTDPAKFRATGELAPFVLSVDAFMREGFEVPEAVALFGMNVLCGGRGSSPYSQYELAPRDPNIHAVSLELYDDTVIGVMIELETPIALDLAKVAKQYGPTRNIPGIHRASDGVAIAVETPAYRGQLMLRPDHRDPSKTGNVIYRRSPAIENLPDKFVTAADVTRLVELVQRPRPAAPGDFYGTLGVFDKAHSTETRDALLPAVAMRNVARAAITHEPFGKRRAVMKLEVTFARRITGRFARTRGVTFDGKRLVIER